MRISLKTGNRGTDGKIIHREEGNVIGLCILLLTKGVPKVSELIGTPSTLVTSNMTQEISTADSRTGGVENLLTENDLQKLIEVLRKELEELYLIKGSFLHPAVQQISQQLDEYIVAFQKLSKRL